jgi:chaperonin GroES
MSEATAPAMGFQPNNDDVENPFTRVLNDHIVLAIDNFHYSGKLVIPDTAKRKPTKGRVIAIADNIKDIKIGDRVLYSQFAGYLLIFEGMPPLRVIGYSEVLGLLKQDAPDLVGESS